MAWKVVLTDKKAQMLILSCISVYLIDKQTVQLHDMDEDGEKSADEGKHVIKVFETEGQNQYNLLSNLSQSLKIYWLSTRTPVRKTCTENTLRLLNAILRGVFLCDRATR